jgi:hypothetical protein
VPQSDHIELLNLDGGPGITAKVTFSGQEDDSKTTWMWKAEDVLANGLEAAPDFWVTIPRVEKGVKAHFKLTS